MKIKRYNPPDIEGIEHKPMLDYEDCYEIYFDGRVWSKYVGRFIHLQDNGKGYLMFNACRNGIKTPKLVHQVVAETFIRPIQRDENGRALEQINHRSRTPGQNNPDNLQILSPEQHHHFHTGQNNGNTGRVVPQEQIERAQATRAAKKAIDPDYYKRQGIKKSKEEIERRKATIEARKAADPDRYKRTPEIIEKVKQTKIANGNYRRKHTEEELRKISQSNKGKHSQSEQQKAKTAATRAARKAENPDYYKREMSKDVIEKIMTTKAAKRAADPTYGTRSGQKQSEETKEKIRQALKGKKKSQQHLLHLRESRAAKKNGVKNEN